jgi:hypothetical protein
MLETSRWGEGALCYSLEATEPVRVNFLHVALLESLGCRAWGQFDSHYVETVEQVLTKTAVRD